MLTAKDPTAFIDFFKANDRLGAIFGVQIISLNNSECICEYKVSPDHFNPNGILHGGALYSAMDSSQGAFVHFTLDPAFFAAATGTATIRYQAPVRQGIIRIRTWLKEKQNRKIYVCSTATDQNGQEVATLEEIWIAMLKS
jgi:uncharacterized protein (TIGR00369 family)